MNIISLFDAQDSFQLEDQSSTPLRLTYFENDSNEGLVKSHIVKKVQHSLPFMPNTVKDLMNLGHVVYSSDQLISRRIHGFDSWSRHLKLHLPVFDLTLWENAKSDIEEILSYLSGDKWELNFRQRIEKRYESIPNPTMGNVDSVCLFSGGMDSFLGAVQLLSSGENIALVSHHKTGQGEHQFQINSLNSIRDEFRSSRIFHHDYWLQPRQKNNPFGKENTSRSRSFLFLTLGILTSSMYGPTTKLVIPENGFISLNIPLTYSRFGASSTRTTHPYYFDLFRKILHHLGITNTIGNPFKYKTKGEMVREGAHQGFLQVALKQTMSCSDPSKARWTPGKTPPMHCGFCVPCIIRRAALHSAGFQNFEEYVLDNLQDGLQPGKESRKNIQGFQRAVRYVEQNPQTTMFHILKAGPIPSDSGAIDEYHDMYLRGIEEIRQLIF